MIEIRKVNYEDSDLLLLWRNHPEIYRYALTAKPVLKVDHEKWFASRVNNPLCYFYMGLSEGVPCGSVRYDVLGSDEEAEVSISLSPEFWGKGIASELMKKAEELLKKESKIKVIFATVLNENKASLRLFEKNNYDSHLTQFKKKLTP